MKAEATEFLAKAREFLQKAAYSLVGEWNDESGRAAYLAGLHAAQALIFERTGRIIKRHRGVQNELYRLTKDEPRFDAELRAFLGRAYNLKEIADYLTGPEPPVSQQQARHAITTAERFIDVIIEFLEEAP